MRKYMIYEFEKMPVSAFGPWEISDVADFLKKPKKNCYPNLWRSLHDGKYLVVNADEPPMSNKYIDALAIACQELGHFTGETRDQAMKRVLARVLLEPNDYARWLKENA